MDLTGSTRGTVAAAGTILLGGLSTVLYGTIRDNLAHSIAGASLTTTALTFIALAIIRQWIVDTSNERQTLASAESRARDECTRYLALRAALEIEQGRLRQGLAAERAALTERLAIERAAMQEELELSRSEVSSEAMRLFAAWYIDGKVCPPERARSNLIAFPQQEPQQQRSREHGVVGP